MFAGQLGVNALVQLAVARPAGVQSLKATVVFGEFLFDDISLNRAAEVVCLAGKVRRDMVVFVALNAEGRIAEVAPENGRHAEFVGECKGFGDFHNLAMGIIRAKINRGSDGCRTHVGCGLHFSKEDFFEGIWIGEEFVMIDLYQKGNFVGVFA